MKEFKSISEFLGLENKSDFPIKIKDKNDNQIYYENSAGFWWKKEFDDKGNLIYCENNVGIEEDKRPK